MILVQELSERDQENWRILYVEIQPAPPAAIMFFSDEKKC